jgi:hypothetical protein
MAVTASWSAAWTARKISATCAGVAVAAEPRAAIAVMSHALSNTCQSLSRDIGWFLLVVPLVDGRSSPPRLAEEEGHGCRRMSTDVDRWSADVDRCRNGLRPFVD